MSWFKDKSGKGESEVATTSPATPVSKRFGYTASNPYEEYFKKYLEEAKYAYDSSTISYELKSAVRTDTLNSILESEIRPLKDGVCVYHRESNTIVISREGEPIKTYTPNVLVEPTEVGTVWDILQIACRSYFEEKEHD